jgi:protein-S-isoprenylcysteine O-methyltransferase Ste14
MSLKLVSLAATSVLVASTLGLLFARWLFAVGPAAIGLQVVAAALMLAARLTFGARSFHAGANPTEGGLVTGGPYRFIRHPIYAAILLFTWAGVGSHLSILSAALGTVSSAAIAVRIATEERLVTAAYPEYAEYARRTKRLIPFVI